ETSPASNVVRNLRHVPRLFGALLGVGRLAGLSSGGEIRYGALDQSAPVVGVVLLAGAVVASTGGVVVAIVRAARRRPTRPDGRGGTEAGEKVGGEGEATEQWLDDRVVFGLWAASAGSGVVGPAS